MDWKNLIQLLAPLWQKIRYSKSTLIYFTAILLGLSMAKFSYAMVLYKVNQENLKNATPVLKVKPRAMRREAVIPDLNSIIGGFIFSTPDAPKVAEVIKELEPTKKFTLVGTLEGDPSFARAVLNVAGEKDGSKEYGTWSKIGIVRITYIGRNYIWIKHSKERFKIKVGETYPDSIQAQKAEAAKAAQIVAQNKPATASGPKIVKVLSRADVNKKLLNPATIYQGASFGPKLKNGKIIGYKIHRVKPSHIFYSLGARAGDIITKVNGFTLDDTEKMFELWKGIKTAPRVEIEIQRGNKKLTYDFHIRN